MRKANAQGREFKNSREFSSSHKLVSCLKRRREEAERRGETILEGFESTEQSKPVPEGFESTEQLKTVQRTLHKPDGLALTELPEASPQKRETPFPSQGNGTAKKGRGGKAQAAAV